MTINCPYHSTEKVTFNCKRCRNEFCDIDKELQMITRFERVYFRFKKPLEVCVPCNSILTQGRLLKQVPLIIQLNVVTFGILLLIFALRRYDPNLLLYPNFPDEIVNDFIFFLFIFINFAFVIRISLLYSNLRNSRKKENSGSYVSFLPQGKKTFSFDIPVYDYLILAIFGSIILVIGIFLSFYFPRIHFNSLDLALSSSLTGIVLFITGFFFYRKYKKLISH